LLALDCQSSHRAVAPPTQPVGAAGAARPLSAIALVLRPQTRGVGPTPIISVAPGSRNVPVELEFEPAGSAAYDVALKDPGSNRIIWRSAPVSPSRDRLVPVVAIGLPAA